MRGGDQIEVFNILMVMKILILTFFSKLKKVK